MTTPPFAPKSISSIRTPCDLSAIGDRRSPLRLSKRDPALPALPGIVVLDAIHEATDQMQPQPAGLALLDRLINVHVGRLRDVERLDIIICQAYFYAAFNLCHVDTDLCGRCRNTVLDHVREQLLQRQVHARQQLGIDALAGKYFLSERENVLNRVKTSSKSPICRHLRGLALDQDHGDIVLLS